MPTYGLRRTNEIAKDKCDIWLDDGLLELPEYPKIMLNIYRKFIGRRRRKALVQGTTFDEEALFVEEFIPEEKNSIRTAQVAKLIEEGGSSDVPPQEISTVQTEDM